jgi:hypothetical protein
MDRFPSVACLQTQYGESHRQAQEHPLLSDIHTRIYTIIIHDNAWDPLFFAPLTHDTTTIELPKRIYIRQTHAPDEEIRKTPSAWHYHPATSSGSLVRVEITAWETIL